MLKRTITSLIRTANSSSLSPSSSRSFLLHTPFISLSNSRSYATENKTVDPKLVDLVHKLQTTPEVVSAINEFNQLISKKGLVADGSFSSFYKIMSDLEIKNALNKVVLEMSNSGIQVSPEILKPVLDAMSKK